MELDGLAAGLVGVCRGVNVLAAVLSGLAGEELGAPLVLEHSGGIDRESRRRSGTLVALELSSRC